MFNKLLGNKALGKQSKLPNKLLHKYPRSSGVLMPVTSLSGPYGIGVLGKEAMEFVDFLCDAGFHAWQILPVEHTGMCNSPYKCISAYAGEPNLIDPDMLVDMGLITEDELNERKQGLSNTYVEYEVVREKQWKLLRTAFSRLDGKPYEKFNPFWLDEYALFIALKLHFGNAPWYEWEDLALRRHDDAAVNRFKKEFGSEIEFHRFVQWLFDTQWKKLREYATKRGISIIGDMPIYVSENSAEVWGRRELFDADDEGNFKAIGGVPPDYFCEDGQRWGNPIYNWKLLKAENYKWWVDRLRANLKRYDVVRIDHFRGFESYWSIPADSKTARTGTWEKGPGMSLFKALSNKLGDLSLSVIAEDLGIIDKKVERLLEKTGLRGMHVLQFAFLGDESHLPHNIGKKSVTYTGTHDNTTLLAWMYELSEADREKVLFYTGFDGDWRNGGPNGTIIKHWMRVLFMTPSSLVVAPIQDMLGYGADTRTNTPGTPSGNWRFRIREGVLDEIDKEYYRLLHKTFARNDPMKEFKKNILKSKKS